MLKSVYCKNISNGYKDHEILYIRQGVKDDKALVYTKIKKRGKDIEIPVNYRLIRAENTWMIYDVIVEGVSVIQN